ncbi:hypothetical protein COE51_01785 [Bacillus pseudomycoides]|nr:hypothetical protein COE51_01785 [Bacillus pseudomycoides]
MKTKNQNRQKSYTRPMVLSSQPIRFETAQSWNCGQGNKDHPGNGNGGPNHKPPGHICPPGKGHGS